MVKRHATPQDKFRFSTDNFIFRSGRLVDPNGSEGKQLNLF